MLSFTLNEIHHKPPLPLPRFVCPWDSGYFRIGPFLPGGKIRLGSARGRTTTFKCRVGRLTPFGLFLPESKSLNLYFPPRGHECF